MAAFDERIFEGVNGAVLYLQQKASKSIRFASDYAVVACAKRSRAIVVSLLAGDDMGPDSVVDSAIRVAQ